MAEPDQYDVDDKLMDELGGAMDEVDAVKMKPLVTITVAVNEGGKEGEKPDEAEPTPEEMDELQKALG